MDITQFLNDANAIMHKIGSLAGATLAVGTATGQILDKGKKLITVLITPQTPEPAQTRQKETGVALAREFGSITGKSDVAILVDVKPRILSDVGRFLAEKKIDADLIVVTNDPTYGDGIRLDPSQPEEWEAIAREFSSALRKIKRAVGRAQLHLFLSTPVPLALALGALMGTVDEGAIVYHWEGGTYWPVVTISRDLWW
jgi:hypothetical protein